MAAVTLSVSYWARRFPAAVHLGTRSLSDFTPEQRERVWPLLDQLGGWMGVATSLFFVYLIGESIRAAESRNPRFHSGWAPLLFAGGMAGLAIYFVSRINREARLPRP